MTEAALNNRLYLSTFTNPTTTAMPRTCLTRACSALRLSRIKYSLYKRSSGGYPVIASSGKATISAFWAWALWIYSMIFFWLPEISPTVVLICARAIRNIFLVLLGYCLIFVQLELKIFTERSLGLDEDA